MLSEEKQLIYGLYHATGIVGRSLAFKPGEIVWLAQAKIPAGRNWRTAGGTLQSAAIPAQDWLSSFVQTKSAAERPLAYLSEKGFISVEIDGDIFRVAVNATGADLARSLGTRLGRIQLAYEENKDKFWWAGFGALLSFVGGWLTKQFVG